MKMHLASASLLSLPLLATAQNAVYTTFLTYTFPDQVFTRLGNSRAGIPAATWTRSGTTFAATVTVSGHQFSYDGSHWGLAASESGDGNGEIGGGAGTSANDASATGEDSSGNSNGVMGANGGAVTGTQGADGGAPTATGTERGTGTTGVNGAAAASAATSASANKASIVRILGAQKWAVMGMGAFAAVVLTVL